MDLRISVAGNYEIVRRGVRAIIEDQPGWKVVSEAADGPQAVKQALSLRPDLSILGVSMPELDGVECAKRIMKSWPAAKILIQAHHSDALAIQDCLDAGIRGIVFKSEAGSELIEAVRTISAGRFHFTSRIDWSVNAAIRGDRVQDPSGRLTAREKELIQAIAEGLSNKEIAARMAVSIRTVETHRARAMEKTGSSSAGALVRWAIRNHVVKP